MKKYSKWKDDEVKKLFKFIEQGKSQNMCLTNLFSSYAKETGRMPNSVRNYYYAELNNLTENKKRRDKLEIDISLHQKIDQQEFTQKETEELVQKILEQTSKGISVRKACLNLAQGDIGKMVRYQNKYRSVVLKDKPIYNNCVEKLKQKGVTVKKELPSNVITFKDRRTLLSDSDINSLFLGLVKLVKKQAGEEIYKNLKIETEKANNMLRKTLVQLSEKETEIKNLRKNFKVLCQENEKLNDEIKTLRGKNAELILNQEKYSALKKFTQKYQKKQKEIN